MTGGKPTPGPWSAFVVGNTIAVDIGPHPTGKRPNVVDWTGFDGCDLPLDQQIANAHLIAAAPETAAERDRLKGVNAELLAALKALVNAVGAAPVMSVDEADALARAAIARAEGGAE